MINKNSNDDSELKCVVPYGTFNAVSNLISTNIKANPYSLQALGSVVESIILYDKIILYDYRPEAGLIESLEKSLSKNVFGKKLIEAGIVVTADPYLSLYDDDEFVEMMKGMTKSFDVAYKTKDGRKGSASLLRMPTFLDFSMDPMIRNFKSELAHEALMQLAPQSFIANIVDKNDFYYKYTVNNLWQIEMGKVVKEIHNADGMLVSPTWRPFWMAEKLEYASRLQKKYDEYKNIIGESKFRNEFSSDFSPLITIALDTALSRDMFFDTLMQMRKDYSELRDVGKKYKYLLKNADTHTEIENIVHDWTNDWDSVLKKIRKPEVPLLRRIFGWDALKTFSLKRIGGNAVYEVYSELDKLNRVNSLSIVAKMDQEFMNSRLVGKRINDLFGGVNPL